MLVHDRFRPHWDSSDGRKPSLVEGQDVIITMNTKLRANTPTRPVIQCKRMAFVGKIMKNISLTLTNVHYKGIATFV